MSFARGPFIPRGTPAPVLNAVTPLVVANAGAGSTKRSGKRRTKNGPKMRAPKYIEQEYVRALLALLKEIEGQTALITRMIDGGINVDSAQLRIRLALSRANRRFDAAAETMAKRNIDAIDKKNKTKLAAAIRRAMGVDVAIILTTPSVKAVLAEAIRNNVALIKTIPAEHFGRVEKAVLQNFRGEPFPEGSLTKRLQKIGGITRNRARLIARDQTSKVNGDINEARQTDLGIDRYIWRTVQDERVTGYPGGPNKPSARHGDHYEREGKTFRWDDPPHDGPPGFAIQCRCFTEPVIDLDRLEQYTSRGDAAASEFIARKSTYADLAAQYPEDAR